MSVAWKESLHSRLNSEVKKFPTGVGITFIWQKILSRTN